MVATADPNVFPKLLDFLARLTEQRIAYRLSSHRDEAVMVEVATPGVRWEVEFLADGTVDVERFRRDGAMAGEDALPELFAAME